MLQNIIKKSYFIHFISAFIFPVFFIIFYGIYYVTHGYCLHYKNGMSNGEIHFLTFVFIVFLVIPSQIFAAIIASVYSFKSANKKLILLAIIAFLSIVPIISALLIFYFNLFIFDFDSSGKIVTYLTNIYATFLIIYQILTLTVFIYDKLKRKRNNKINL